jgi:hypothetical protein
MIASLTALLSLAALALPQDCVSNGERDVYVEFGDPVEVCVPPVGTPASVTYKVCPNGGGTVEQELYSCVTRRSVTTLTYHWGTHPATGKSCIVSKAERKTEEEVGRRDWNNGESCPPGAEDCCIVHSSEWWYEYGEQYTKESEVKTPHECPDGWGLKVTTTVDEYQYRRVFVLTNSTPTGNCPTVECGLASQEGPWTPMFTGSSTTVEIHCGPEPEPLALLLDPDASERDVVAAIELEALRSGHGSTELPLTCELGVLLH